MSAPELVYISDRWPDEEVIDLLTRSARLAVSLDGKPRVVSMVPNPDAVPNVSASGHRFIVRVWPEDCGRLFKGEKIIATFTEAG